MTEEQLRELFREMREDPVPPDSLVRMREAVAGGIRRRNWWRDFWLVAAPALLALLTVNFWPKVRAPEALPPLVAVYPAPPEIVVAGRVAAAPPARRTHSWKPVLARQAAEPLVIRIETDDPTIVILLTGD